MDPKHFAGMTVMGAACIALALFQNSPKHPGDAKGLVAPSIAATVGAQPVTGDVPAGLAPVVRPVTKPVVKTPVVKKPVTSAPVANPETTEKPAEKATANPVETQETPSTTPTSVARTGDGPSVKGAVTWTGDYKNSLIKPTSDPVCAEKWDGKEMRKETTVEEGGKLQNVIVYVSKGIDKWSGRTRTEEVMLDQHDCQYTPHVIAIQIGQPLKIKNSDPTSHNVHFKSKFNGDWNMSQNEPGVVDPKEAFRRAEVGTAQFKCDQHTWMEARVGIFDHPFFDVTGKSGSFELPGDLPPGKYTLTAWHEKHGTQTAEIEVVAGKTVETNFAFTAKKGGRR